MATFGGIGRTGIADVRTVDTSDPRNPRSWAPGAMFRSLPALGAVQACFEDLREFL